MKNLALAFLILVFSSLETMAACDLYRADEGFRFCKRECEAGKMDCGSVYKMKDEAQYNRAGKVSEAYGVCQTKNSDERENVKNCSLEDPDGLVKVACNVFGCVKNDPKPVEKNLEKFSFDQAMIASDTSNIIVQSTVILPKKGEFQFIQMDFERDGLKTWLMGTYDVKVGEQNGVTTVTVSTYDRRHKGRDNVHRHKYRIHGIIALLVEK
ncbi:MAG: hypothetical protein WBO55_08645 [Rhizobiaceae bacterium]